MGRNIMKIIAISDIHMDLSNLPKIYDEVSSADLLIVTGDFTNYGGKREALNILEPLKKVNPNILAVHGNLDKPEVLELLEEEGISIHGKGVVLKNGLVGIFGVGGSNKTPFNTPSEYSEAEIKQLLMQGYTQVKDAKIKIMVPHMPPANTKLDVIKGGMHVGSEAVRSFITTYSPNLVLTGHIHEARGEDSIGLTKIINIGPFREGGYVYTEIQESDPPTLTATLKIIS